MFTVLIDDNQVILYPNIKYILAKLNYELIIIDIEEMANASLFTGTLAQIKNQFSALRI